MRTSGATSGLMPPTAVSPERFNAFVERLVPSTASHGPLTGMTFAVKDCLDVAGRAPGCGLALRSGAPPASHDAPVIHRLREAGAVLIGMAQMTAMAYEPSGANAILGRPVNPINGDFICGGSSSGSAVAVAAGDVDIAIGTDTAGSLRIPAHCCGIAAWKPSAGLISTEGVLPLASSLDTVGFLAGKASELGRLAPIMGAEPHAPFVAMAVAADLAADASPALKATLQACIVAAGVPIQEVEALPLIRACDAPVLTLLQGEAYRAHAERIAEGVLDPVLTARLEKGSAISDANLASARETLAALRGTALDALLGRDEVLLLPVMLCETPRVAVCEPESPTFSPRALYALSALTRFANGLGLPVVTIPAGRDNNNMPIGVQLVARRGRDADLIAVASTIERHLHEKSLRALP
jgi:Asp-tRNA(Asn)/Glu-tRNA(Gln) amidotransferase A subunit family amidase